MSRKLNKKKAKSIGEIKIHLTYKREEGNRAEQQVRKGWQQALKSTFIPVYVRQLDSPTVQ